MESRNEDSRTLDGEFWLQLRLVGSGDILARTFTVKVDDSQTKEATQ